MSEATDRELISALIMQQLAPVVIALKSATNNIGSTVAAQINTTLLEQLQIIASRLIEVEARVALLERHADGGQITLRLFQGPLRKAANA